LTTEIPPVPPVPDELRLAALEGRLVPFIGAGASRLANCPSWEEFAQRLFRQLVQHGTINYSQAEQIRAQQLSPRVRLSIARTIAKQGKVELDYQAAVHPDRDVSNPNGRRLYGALGRLSRSNVFVTTNYDAWLDEIIEPPPLALTDVPGTSPSAAPAKRNVIHQVDDFSYDHLLTDNTVIHLHGSLSDPASMVVTTGDYLERYRNDGGAEVGQENKATSFLRSLFKSKTVLFIGYGLDELEILEYIILKSRNEARTGETVPKHYILQPYFSHELEMARHMEAYYSEECGVSLLPYLRDERDFGQLIDVIEYFAREIPIAATMGVQRRLEMEGLLDS
jgi:hypothetical protein